MQWVFKRIAGVLGLLLIVAPAKGTIKTSRVNGNWSNVVTWGEQVPGINDTVYIRSGTTVNLNQTTVNALSLLVIEPGGKLRITVTGSGIHINGNIENKGELVTWNSNTEKGTIFLHGNSYWSGNGSWNLGMLSLDNYALEFEEDMVISFADNITGNASAALNRLNRRERTVFIFNGTENASVLSDGNSMYYPGIAVNKSSANGAVSVSFKDSPALNALQILGPVVLMAPTDRLAVGSMNQLALRGSVTGNGTISGGETSDLLISGNGARLDPLRLTSGTSFNTVTVSRPSGVAFQNSFMIRKELVIAAGSLAVLPPGGTLTLGVNGSAPSQGKLDCQGWLYTGNASALTVRGSGADPVELKFFQGAPENHTLNNLEIARMSGAGETKLAPAASLVIDGTLQIDSGCTLNLANGKLFLNLSVAIHAGGYLTGSDDASLLVQGSGGNATLRFNPYGPMANRTLKYLEINRTPGRIITLGNTLGIREQVNVLSGRLNSNGNLVLVASASGSAAIGPLSPSADVIGEVVVQSWLTGGNGMRGTRMLSATIDDATTEKSLYQQLQEQMLVTGPGGQGSGFDAGGILQPQAITIQTYYEPAGVGHTQFRPLPDIFQRSSSSAYPGPGHGFFFFFRGNRANAVQKLNASNGNFAMPEHVVLSCKGPVFKRNQVVQVLYTANPGDPYNGYQVLGNPYPSAIDWRKVSKVNMDDLLAIIKPGGGMVTYSNGITVNAASGLQDTSGNIGFPYIQSGQAFYVRAAGPDASVTFTENCKAPTASPGRFLAAPGDRFLVSGKAASHLSGEQEREPWPGDLVRIKLANNGRIDETAIVFKEGSNPAMDPLDAVAFTGTGSSLLLASTSANGVKLAINFVPPLTDTTEMMLNIQGLEAGEAVFFFSGLQASPGYEIFFHDRRLGKTIDIRQVREYRFAVAGEDPQEISSDRFKLIFRPKNMFHAAMMSEKELVIFPVPVKNRIRVRTHQPLDPLAQLSIYDLSGRKQLTIPVVNQEDVSFLSSGQYIAEVTGASGKLVGRVRFIKE